MCERESHKRRLLLVLPGSDSSHNILSWMSLLIESKGGVTFNRVSGKDLPGLLHLTLKTVWNLTSCPQITASLARNEEEPAHHGNDGTTRRNSHYACGIPLADIVVPLQYVNDYAAFPVGETVQH